MPDLDAYRHAHRAEEWHEDDEPALWWVFPIQEPPYVGTPLDTDWPSDYGYNYWTRIIVPEYPDRGDGI